MKADADQPVANDQQAAIARGDSAREVPVTRGLSAQLLVLTIAFVMVAEVLIYVPSVARDRLVFLEERIVAADLATLALEEAPNNNVSDALARELLDLAGGRAIVLRGPLTRRLVVADRTPEVLAETFDLREVSGIQGMRDAFSALFRQENRVIRVIGQSSQNPDSSLEVIIDEAPLRARMIAFSERLLSLSVVISLVTASLVFLTLNRRMVRPMRRVTRSMVKFRRHPEDPKSVIVPSKRRDEIGVAERELSVMQDDLRSALRQNQRLAELGSAVTKINHDLRNILATATLVSDRIASIDDPEVQKLTPTLIQSIDRAVALCNNTLRFGRVDEAPPQLNEFDLRQLVDDVGTSVGAAGDGQIRWNNEVPERFMMVGDRDQIFRALLNLARNAVQAIDGMGNGVNGPAGQITTRAARGVEKVEIEIADTGPGMPTRAIESVFQPFSGTAKAGGSGLGLAIVRDLVRAHGGDVALVRSNDDGTEFRMEFPGA
ncbi:MAG: HAMP domain-containing histidine kinase [Alphaproteobacteria bacterium]|nr:HAMP domain-containing histidine kinase [Alphaproteobacteria bacterium]